MKAPWPSVGVHYNLTQAQYFAPNHYRGQRIFSKSLAAQFAPDPAVWKTLDDAGQADVESDAISWGSLIDLMAFRPKEFEQAYAVTPATYVSAPVDFTLTTDFPGEWNGRKKECQVWKKEREAEGLTVMTPEQREESITPKPWNWNSTTCQQWAAKIRAERPGCQIVTDAELAEARKAVAALHASAKYQELIAGAAFQVGMLAIYQGIPVRGALDILPAASGVYGDALADLKTCSRMGSEDELRRHIYAFGYHVQAWLYLSLWNALNPDDKRSRFVFAFQSSSPPYEVAVLQMPARDVALGGSTFERQIALWKECNDSGVWPSKWDGIDFIGLPKFAYREEYDGVLA